MLHKDHRILIPERHKNIVLDRINNTKEEDFLKWNDVKDKIITAKNEAIASNKTKNK